LANSTDEELAALARATGLDPSAMATMSREEKIAAIGGRRESALRAAAVFAGIVGAETMPAAQLAAALKAQPGGASPGVAAQEAVFTAILEDPPKPLANSSDDELAALARATGLDPAAMATMSREEKIAAISGRLLYHDFERELRNDGDLDMFKALVEAVTGYQEKEARAPSPPEGLRASPEKGGERGKKEKDRNASPTGERSALHPDMFQEEHALARLWAKCGCEEPTLSAEAFARSAERWLGVELRRVALRVHEVIAKSHICGGVFSQERVRSWWQSLKHGPWDVRVDFAFAVFDLDGDGVISPEDALYLRADVEHVAALRKKVDDRFTMDDIVHESFLCEEIINLTSLVFDGDEKSRKDGDGIALNAGLFRQIKPESFLYQMIRSTMDGDGSFDDKKQPSRANQVSR